MNRTWLLMSVFLLSPFRRPLLHAEESKPEGSFVRLPGGEGGLRLDDYYFDKILGRLVVPAGRTGRLDLIDPKTRNIGWVSGFAAPKDSTGPAGGGVTSADGHDGIIFATDRTDRTLYVVDGAQRIIIATAALAAGPDYVRYVAPTREIWVTEPNAEQIEVFSTGNAPSDPPKHAAVIGSSRGEYEALVVDAARGRAYSNQGKNTVAIDLKTRAVVAIWKSGCKVGEGLALDEGRGFLMVACEEGRVTVLDAAHGGKRLSIVKSGDGIDIVAYAADRNLLAIPGRKSATIAFAALSDEGELTILSTATGVQGGHCVAMDNLGAAWVCDGTRGGLAVFVGQAGKP